MENILFLPPAMTIWENDRCTDCLDRLSTDPLESFPKLWSPVYGSALVLNDPILAELTPDKGVLEIGTVLSAEPAQVLFREIEGHYKRLLEAKARHKVSTNAGTSKSQLFGVVGYHQDA